MILFASSTFLAQTDTTEEDSPEFLFTPRFAGVQVEGCVLFFGYEYGGTVDVDLFSHKKNKHFIGIRLAYEKYAYEDPGGGRDGPFTEFCLYGRPSIKFKRFQLNAYGGLSYHLGWDDPRYNYDKKVIFRVGFDVKYIPVGNLIGIMLKCSTSFIEDLGFVGIGLSIGYYN